MKNQEMPRVRLNKKLLAIIPMALINFGCAANPTQAIRTTQTMPSSELKDYSHNPASVKQLLSNAFALNNRHLTYKYGSDNPSNGGMDCSGTIYYLLKKENIDDVPRQADQMYQWVWEKGQFYAVNSRSLHTFEFSKLQPGDLLFWTGTYNVHRDPPVTHVMLYLGKNKENEPIMFGANETRLHARGGIRGVTIMPFRLSDGFAKGRFIGYSCIPGLNCQNHS